MFNTLAHAFWLISVYLPCGIGVGHDDNTNINYYIVWLYVKCIHNNIEIRISKHTYDKLDMLWQQYINAYCRA